ncbi:hypothetical protein N7530_011494 [Penicillium desertorum]|jgi:hypothetical protein|uniref:Uncharacterized protein n=1 Tax=Penicillium desertorum TaxID=1303715 RepID=A0A9W9WDJ3_9EURO|nr:hypothetical protein N7530_011494 [Penicillium desertorum]
MGDTEIPSNPGNSQCASKQGVDWRRALKIGLGGGPIGGTAGPTGQVNGTTVHAKTLGGTTWEVTWL